jgi:hypothetical protein
MPLDVRLVSLPRNILNTQIGLAAFRAPHPLVGIGGKYCASFDPGFARA